MRIAVLPLLAACAGTATRTEPPSPRAASPITVEPIAPPIVAASVEAVEPAVVPAPAAAVAPTVQLVRRTVVYKAPRLDADELGVIRAGTRVALTSSDDGDGTCAYKWIAIAPRGWICDDNVETTDQPPTAAVAHSLSDDDADDDRPVPGTYGTVRGADAIAYDSAADARAGTNGRVLVGSNSVRAAGVVTIDGRRFWRTSRGDLIAATAIHRFSPSKFRGVVIEPGAAMPAWTRAHHDPKQPVLARSAPSARAHVVGKLELRTVVTIEETSANGKFVRIGDHAWIARDDVRIATVTEPPTTIGASEKWFDVDLDDQVLVAYEGTTPVYATLVSTGKSGHRTPARITRVKSKLERATMNSDDGEVYSVADVPWTMYYDAPGFALHTAYWHNGFGGPRSHGCINLAPHDARVLYHWSSPDVPPGWVAVNGDEDNPGSLVRVRSHKVPEPAFRGYARRMLDKERS